MISALFVYHRAKLGYGLLSGEYSKPAPDPGDENGASEPRVRRNDQPVDLQVFTDIHGTLGIYSQKLVRMSAKALTIDKVGCSCLQGDQIGIAPRMFKALVGRGHPEFSTNRQQDAQEFLLHFINMVEVKLLSYSASLYAIQLFSLLYHYFFSPAEELSLWGQPI